MTDRIQQLYDDMVARDPEHAAEWREITDSLRESEAREEQPHTHCNEPNRPDWHGDG